jgi:transketolase
MRDAFIRELEVQARLEPRVFLLTGDLGFGVVEEFSREFPNQFLNAGVAEQNMMGLAAGLADSGMLPFVYSIANFPTFRCLEQIRNDVCYPELPVTIVSIGAGLAYGSLGYSHHAVEDLSVMRSLPGMRVISPCDPNEVKAAVRFILNDPAPTYLRLGKNGEPSLQITERTTLGGTCTLREGSGLLILTTGAISNDVLRMVSRSTKPAIMSAQVVSIPIVKPMDLSLINYDEFDHIVSVEEHSIVGGLNSAIYEYLRDRNESRRILAIGLEDAIRHYAGSAEHLKLKSHLDREGMETQILKFISG